MKTCHQNILPVLLAGCLYFPISGLAGDFYGSYGGWPTYMTGDIHNWPTAEDYDQLVQDFNWTYVALKERAAVLGCYTPAVIDDMIGPATAGTRSPRDDIQRFKVVWFDICWYGNWVDPAPAAETGNYNDYLATGRYIPLIMDSGFDTTTPPEYKYLPNNYLEYTPDKCLYLIGPFTDDPSVGHPHGWYNAYTADGGVNGLPPGRTKWYTTDYGLKGLHDVLDLCKWTSSRGSLTHASYEVVSEPFGNSPDGNWITVVEEDGYGPWNWDGIKGEVEGLWNAGAQAAERIEPAYDDGMAFFDVSLYWDRIYDAGAGEMIYTSFQVGYAELVSFAYNMFYHPGVPDLAHSAQFYSFWERYRCFEGIPPSDTKILMYTWDESAKGVTRRVSEDPLNQVLNLPYPPDYIGHVGNLYFAPEVLLKWDGPNGLTARQH